MSLLEDIFLEDEAGEAQELERIIEGDDADERPLSAASNSDDNSEKEDEATEDKRRVDPTKAKTTRVVKNPRVILNPARLTGPRGIQVIPDHFKDFKFKGKGHEKEDLDLVLKKLEHWAYRLFPKFEFADCLKKIETLGKKRPVMVHLHKIRSDQYTTEETVVQRDSSDDEQPAQDQPPEEDEFDKLLQQQIELARATPAPGSVSKRGFQTPSTDKKSPFTMPKATSSPSISDEQRDRMIRNRQLAEERRLARLKQNTNTNISSPTVDLTNVDGKNSNDVDVNAVKKHNRSNVIDSSDDEDSNAINKLDTVDIQMHDTAVKDVSNVNDESASTAIIDRQEVNGNKTVKKDNKSNVIGSSDDENTNVISQPITVDVHMLDTTVKDVIEVNDELTDTNIIDKINDEGTQDKNDTVDLTEGIPIKHSSVFKAGQVIDILDEDSNDTGIRRNEKNNVADSSDDECETTSLNYSVSVDVHSKNTESMEKERQTSNTENGKNEDNRTEAINEEFEEIQNRLTEDVNQIDDIEITTTKQSTEMAKVGEQNENNAPETVTNEKDINSLDSEMSLDNKENVDSNVQYESNDPVEELMDVDFSDDF